MMMVVVYTMTHDLDGNRKGADPRPKVVEAEPYYAI